MHHNIPPDSTLGRDRPLGGGNKIRGWRGGVEVTAQGDTSERREEKHASLPQTVWLIGRAERTASLPNSEIRGRRWRGDNLHLSPPFLIIKVGPPPAASVALAQCDSLPDSSLSLQQLQP